MATEQVAEQVAEHLEEAAKVTRKIDQRVVGTFFGGFAVGAFFGFVLGYRFNREKIKAEAFKQSEEEVEKIREMYATKVATAVPPKPTVEELMVERGYSTKAVEVEEVEEISARPLRPPVPITEEELRERPLHPTPTDPSKRIFRTELTEKDKHTNWSFPREMAQRSSDRPYIIHQDEFANNDSEWPQVSYVYYAEDDVLTDTDDSPIENRDEIIGPGVLNRFGHGTDDYNIVYVRNPVLELEMEICRSPGSYQEEVLGLDPYESNHDNSEEN